MMEHPCPLYTTTHSLLTEALSGSELTVRVAAAKHIHRDQLPYPDVWYFAGGIAEFLMKRLFLS